jgi:hypothetical protein
VTTISEEVNIYVVELGITVAAHLLANSPCLLSLGLLFKDYGFDYHWGRGHDALPYLQKSGGPRIFCQCIHNVPTITTASDAPDAGGEPPNNTEAETPSAKPPTCKPCEGHNLLTHFPKDPNCGICNGGKTQKQQCRRKKHGEPDDLPVPTKLADAITADHAILNDDQASRKGHTVVLVILDRFTHWLQGYSSKKIRRGYGRRFSAIPWAASSPGTRLHRRV